jgi:hypothetical protein
MQDRRLIVEDLRMPTVWIVILGVILAVNLRFIVPGLLAFLGIWKPPVSGS